MGGLDGARGIVGGGGPAAAVGAPGGELGIEVVIPRLRGEIVDFGFGAAGVPEDAPVAGGVERELILDALAAAVAGEAEVGDERVEGGLKEWIDRVGRVVEVELLLEEDQILPQARVGERGVAVERIEEVDLEIEPVVEEAEAHGVFVGLAVVGLDDGAVDVADDGDLVERGVARVVVAKGNPALEPGRADDEAVVPARGGAVGRPDGGGLGLAEIGVGTVAGAEGTLRRGRALGEDRNEGAEIGIAHAVVADADVGHEVVFEKHARGAAGERAALEVIRGGGGADAAGGIFKRRDAEALARGGGEPERLHQIAVGGGCGEGVGAGVIGGAEDGEILAQINFTLDAERVVLRGGGEETGFADDEVAQLGEGVGDGVFVAGEDAEPVQAEVAGPAGVAGEILLVCADGARLMHGEVGPVALAGGAIGLEVGAAVERVGGRAVGQEAVDVDEDVVGVVGEELRGLVAVGFEGVAEFDEGRVRDALLDRGSDVAAAAEVEARPAGGVGIPRKAGVEERLGVGSGGGAVGEIDEDGVAHVLEIHERGHGILWQNKELVFRAEGVGAGGAVAEGEGGGGGPAGGRGIGGAVEVGLRIAGALGGEPVQVAVVARHGGRWASIATVDVFALDANRGVFERLIRAGDEGAAVFLVAGPDEELLVFPEGGEAEREFLRDEHLAEVEGGALGAVAVGAERELLAVAGEVGAGGGAFGGAGGTAEAELHGVGSAHEAEALGVVGVGIDGRAKIIPGLVDVAEAAGIAGVVGAVARAGARVAVAVDVVEVGLGRRRKEEGLVGRGGAEVVEKLLGEDLHLARDIGEVDLAAAALEDGGGLVAALAVGADLEGREHDGLLFGGCGGGRRGCGWWVDGLGGKTHGQRGGEQGEGKRCGVETFHGTGGVNRGGEKRLRAAKASGRRAGPGAHDESCR